jgi:Rod binding domain-containing protein
MDMPTLSPMPFVAPGPDSAQLQTQAHEAGSKTNDAVAFGFESMFTSMLVKQLRQSLGPDSMFGQDHGDILGGLFDFYLGQHLAKAGSLGIGAMVKKQLEAKKKP